MRVPKGFSGILLIKKVWDGSFIIHYEDDYYHTHDDGPVELTFTITEVNNMTPEEF